MRRRLLMRSASRLVLTISAVGGAQTAVAQSGDVALGDIVVTAQKRSQSLQDVPIAIAALSGSTLRDAGVVSMQGAALLVPSLAVIQSDSPINTSYRVRGVGSDANIPTFEPDVGLFVDGVYMVRSGLGIDELSDVERIEVLKGPQSTLYGKNVTAGVVNVITRAPSDHLEVFAEATLSRIEGSRKAPAYRLSGSVSGPLGDHVRARVTGVWYDQAATYKNLTVGAGDSNNAKRYALRGAIDFDLGAAASLRVNASHAQLLRSNTVDPTIFYGSTAVFLDSTLGPAFGVTPCAVNDPNKRIICSSSPYATSASNDVVSATLTAKIGAHTLTSISAWTGYRSDADEPDADQLQLPITAFRNFQKGQTLSQEVRLASSAKRTLEWLVGGYYLHTSLNLGDGGRSPAFRLGPAAAHIPLDPTLPPEIVLGQVDDLGFQNSRARSDYLAVFGQASWHVSETLSITGGLRWQTEIKRETVNNFSRTSLNPALIGTGFEGINLVTSVLSSPAGNGDYRRKKNAVTYSATADWKPARHTLLYATYARGGKSGGTNIGFGNAPRNLRPFGDETVDNYEVGAKVDLADKRVRLAGSLFHTVYDQFQNAGFVSLQFLVNNAEKVTVDGAEVDATIALASGLTLNAGWSHIDAKYKQYLGGACAFGRPPDALLDPTTGAFTACDLSGRGLPLSPKDKTTLGVQYEHDASFGAVYGRADWAWSSRYQTNTNLDLRLYQPAYSLVNVRLGARLRSGPEISVWSTNLFNRTIIIADGVHNLLTDESFQRFLSAPREIGITFRIKG